MERDTAVRGRPRSPYASARQRLVLDLVASGLTTKEIAAQLDVSVACVKKHIGKLLVRYGATNRASLVAAMFRAGSLEVLARGGEGIAGPG